MTKHWDGTETMPFVDDDGGRADAGYKGQSGDCVCRSIAIATSKPYSEVYQELNFAATSERPRRGKRSSARTGVNKRTIRKYLASLGWIWTPTMGIGTGCTVHLLKGELPDVKRLIVSVSKHMTTIVDGVIHDTFDPQRCTIVTENGETRLTHRCVYGYWVNPN